MQTFLDLVPCKCQGENIDCSTGNTASFYRLGVFWSLFVHTESEIIDNGDDFLIKHLNVLCLFITNEIMFNTLYLLTKPSLR